MICRIVTTMEFKKIPLHEYILSEEGRDLETISAMMSSNDTTASKEKNTVTSMYREQCTMSIVILYKDPLCKDPLGTCYSPKRTFGS